MYFTYFPNLLLSHPPHPAHHFRRNLYVIPLKINKKTAMAKSTRSKVKRSFRSKKRTQGVFAVADAARLQRLNAKLIALTNTSSVAKDEEGEEGQKEQQDVDLPGSCWFAAFGLLNHQNINPTLMQSLGFFPSRSSAYSPHHPMSSYARSSSSSHPPFPPFDI